MKVTGRRYLIVKFVASDSALDVEFPKFGSDGKIILAIM